MSLLRDATTRLIAAHLLLVALSTALVLGVVYWRAGGVIDAEARRVVEAELRGLADDYARGGAAALAAAMERRLAAQEAGREAVYLLASPGGLRLAGNLARWPATLAPGSGWATLELLRVDTDRATTISGLSLLLPRGERLFVGRDVAARAAFDRALGEALAWALAAMAALTLATGWLLSRLVQSRFAEIDRVARRIVAGDLDHRAPLRGSGDEFDRLAGALNAMLDRVAKLVADLRMVTDSLAHDIRSPLGRLRRRIEAALDPDAPDAQRRADLAQAMAEADGVLALSSALLEISRVEAGLGAEQFGPVDLGRLAEDAAELYAAVAEERGVRLTCAAAPGVVVEGHAQLLAQALANLMDNALAHADGSPELALGVGGGPGGATLSVADRGPGVPAADRERLTRRFERMDPSRAGGAGLGLALVAAVAKLHGAALTLSDNAPGLVATLRFPPQAGRASATR